MYELWDMVSYGHGEPMVPFSLVSRHERFEVIYGKFMERIETIPCVITVNTKKDTINE